MRPAPWRFGIASQAMLPLVGVGAAAAIAAAWLVFAAVYAEAERNGIAGLERLAELRLVREQPGFARAEEDLRRIVRRFGRRLDRSEADGGPRPALAPAADGALRSPPDAPISTYAAAPGPQAQAMLAAAVDALADERPAWDGEPAAAHIAGPGWLAATGPGAADLTRSLRGAGSVPAAERALLAAADGAPMWSPAHLDPATGTWRIALLLPVDLPGGERGCAWLELPMASLIARAARDQPPGSRTLAIDAGGSVLAPAPGGGVALADPGLEPLARAALAATSPVAAGPDGGWLGITRFARPELTMVTAYPGALVRDPAAAVAQRLAVWLLLGALAMGVAAFAILRVRVARPLAALVRAAGYVEQGVRQLDLSTRRVDEIGDLARALARMTEAVARGEAALREREALSRALFEGAGDAVVLIEAGRISDANRRAEDLFGRTRGELIGSPLAAFVPGADPPAAGGALTVWQGERPDGTAFAAEASLVAVAAGGRAAVLAVARDVAERRRLEERLHHAERLEAVGRLAGGIAHDFNNMLAGMQGAAELLDRRLEPGHPGRRMAGIILTSVRRASDLTRQLLLFSRKHRSITTAVEIDQVVRDAVALLERSLDRRVRIRLDLAAAGAAVQGDPAMLQSALINLGINAGDAMPAGGELRIATAAVELVAGAVAGLAPGRHLRIEVADTGQGMSEAVRARIFEPFFTTKPAGRGTGLGLAAVLATVEDHRGAIAVDSRPGHGSVFRIWLPAAEPPPAGDGDAPVLPRGRGRVLVVDDEPAVQAVVAAILDELGYAPVLAGGVAAAQAATGPFAAALVDLALPDGSGRVLTQILRAAHPGLPVVAMSGHNPESQDLDLAALGLAGFLAKPFSSAALAEVLARCAAGRRR